MSRNTSRPPTSEEIRERHAFRDRLLDMLDSLQIAPGTFAKKAGIATGTMYYLLQEGDATRSTLASIAKAGGVSLDWLVLGSGSKPAQSPSVFFMKAAEVAFRKAFKSSWAGLSIEEKNGFLTWAASLFVNLMAADKESAEAEFLEGGNNKQITDWVVQAVHLRAGLSSDDTVTITCRALVEKHAAQAKTGTRTQRSRTL